MKHVKPWFLYLVLLTIGYFSPLQAQEAVVTKTSLQVGQRAPDFALLSDQWETVKLSDFRGKKSVLLVFYVLAFSPD